MERQLEWPFQTTPRKIDPLVQAQARELMEREQEREVERAYAREQEREEAREVERARARDRARRMFRERARRLRGPVEYDGRDAGPVGDLAEGMRELERFIADVGGGRIEAPRVDGERVVVPLLARDGERYFLEIRAPRYLARPPQCCFVDASGRRVETAWPADHPLGPFRHASFICTPPTAEYHHYHSENPYRYGEGSLENTVATIFAALHGRGYAGRYAKREHAGEDGVPF